jgi:hypothetical protein
MLDINTLAAWGEFIGGVALSDLAGLDADLSRTTHHPGSVAG